MSADRVTSLLRKTEQGVRAMIGEAAAVGEYERVARLTSIARRLADMASESGEAPFRGPEPTATDSGAGPSAPASATPAPIRRRGGKQGYPRFERSRDMLVKIGWSKKERGEYVHKAPKAGLLAIARRAVEVGREGRMFTTDELLPVRIGSGEDELPGYQGYLCLAWLREIGLVATHGREGYSVVGDDLSGSVNRIWDTLPASRR